MTETVYVWDKSKRQFSDFIPPLTILIGGLIFLIGTGYAILVYETSEGKYRLLSQFFSELGVRKDYIKTNNDGSVEQVFSPDNPEIFNFSLILAGFLVIPFFPLSYRQMRNKSKTSRYLFLIAIFFGALAGPFLAGVGLVDLSVKKTDSYGFDKYLTDHHFWAGSLYLLISIASIFWLLGITFAKDLPYQSSKWIFLDYLLIFLIMINVIISLLDNFNLVAVKDVPYFDALPIEAYQKFIAYLFFIYYGLVVGLRLLSVKYDNTPGIRKISID